MLISTSRKPSQKTRKFCKNLAHATGSSSVNRGKMNMRDIFLKAVELDEFNIAIVNEIKGNPSRISFYSNKGELLITLLVGVTIDNERLNILPSKLKMVSEIKRLNILCEILDIDLVEEASENYILVSKDDSSYARIFFFNKFGDKVQFQINVKKVIEVVND